LRRENDEQANVLVPKVLPKTTLIVGHGSKRHKTIKEIRTALVYTVSLLVQSDQTEDAQQPASHSDDNGGEQ
jgi:hypothetical protein